MTAPMPKNSSTLSCEILSRAADVSALADAIEDWAGASGIQPKTIKYVGLMLDELIANVVSHAYGGREDGRIEVTAAYDGSIVTVTLRDYGPAFDPTQLAPAATDQGVEEREIGGLGVHFVRRIADQFSYRRDGNANEIVFCKAAPIENPGRREGRQDS